MNGKIGNIDMATVAEAADGILFVCDRCPDHALHPATIRTAFWQNDNLAIVQGIPAMVCPNCGTEYVDDATVVRLDRLRAGSFRGRMQAPPLLVPVYDFGGG